MDFLSFVMALPAAVITKKKDNDEALPTFKPKWWYRSDRLDARPVAWSLRNRPEEWEWNNSYHTYIKHKPSKHIFRANLDEGQYYLSEIEGGSCSCSNMKYFQKFHKGIFRRAFKHWANQQVEPIREQFASHFVTPSRRVNDVR